MSLIIDVHTHIFGAKEIPLEGYLRSRKAKNFFEKWRNKALSPLVAKCIRREVGQEKTLLSGIGCSAVMWAVYAAMGEAYRGWAETLSKQVPEIVEEMLKTYVEDKIDLFVPLMIDYEYWFKSTTDHLIKDQIDLIFNKVVLPYKGKIHPFVPFDPARELAYRKGLCNPDDQPEEHGSFQLVRNAIESQGFMGVKLYNSMGYKPYYNADVNEERRKIALHKNQYRCFKGEEYDQVLGELYDYCVDNDVPITTHCGMYGIESYPDASFVFGKAIFWREVLQQERYRKLRLNLAHYGWYPAQGYRGDITWVEDICRMLSQNENLFADISCHSVMEKRDVNKFKADYKNICREFPIVKKRLLFGTDWHVNKRLDNFPRFKNNYIEILRQGGSFSEAEIQDFLGGNALDFLALRPGGGNRRRLENFYRANGIDPPAWFAATNS
ncbi:MAG TPA: amidohydrolase family protein [bacterium]